MASRANQHRPTAQAKRYRAGQVPKDYVDELSDSSDEEQQEQQEQQLRQPNERQLQFAQKEVVTGLEKIEISEQEAASDRRLRRLRQAQQEKAQTAEGRRRRRFTEAPEQVDTDEDEEKRAEARLRMKERALQLQKAQEEEQRRLEERQQEVAAKERQMQGEKEEEEEEEEDESSSEYETDSEDEEADTIKRMPKPVFIPKAHRETILQEEKRRQMEEERERRLEEELERRKQQSHDLLAQELKREREAEAEKDLSKYEVDVDDTDFGDQAEFDAWKVRELKRIKRDREERIAREREQEEIERRRELPEDVRLKMDLEEAEKTRQKERGQFTFMQKYYHKGAFYQDKDDEVFKRDYSAPTVDEVRKRELLPKVMQVKNFGFAGRTKWTHLANEDTSVRPEDDPWSNPVPIKRRRRD